MSKRLLLWATAVGLVSSTSPAVQPVAPLKPPEFIGLLRSGHYLAALESLERSAFDADARVVDPGLYSGWYQIRPFLTGVAEVPLQQDGGPPLPPTDVALLKSAAFGDAIDEVRRAARNTHIVILNEAHNVPRHRAFALEIAKALRPLGYRLLALETLNNGDSSAERLARDGYARLSTGFYTLDPVYADMVRQSIKMGYRPIAYEMTEKQNLGDNPLATREQAQADNLTAALAGAAPGEKLLVLVGHSHVAETPLTDNSGKAVEWMAARLKRSTGIDPLTIDQATVDEAAAELAGREAYALVRGRVRRDGVLKLNGRPIAVGDYRSAVDLQVVHPPVRFRGGRPDWLAAMDRRPRPIPPALWPRTGRRLVQAFLSREAEDAVPIDQVIVRAGDPLPVMMLPNQPVRYAVSDSS